MVQVPLAGIANAVTDTAVGTVRLTTAAQPILPETIDVAPAESRNDAGKLSVNAAPMTATATGLTMVKASEVEAPEKIDAAPKAFVNVGVPGGTATVRVTALLVAVNGLAPICNVLEAVLVIIVPGGVGCA